MMAGDGHLDPDDPVLHGRGRGVRRVRDDVRRADRGAPRPTAPPTTSSASSPRRSTRARSRSAAWRGPALRRRAHRRRAAHVPHPARRGRQRDDPQRPHRRPARLLAASPTRSRKLLDDPSSSTSPSTRSCATSRRCMSFMPHGHRGPRRTRARPARRATGCSCSTSRPTATRTCSTLPTSSASTATPTRTSASASAPTTASAPTWPGPRSRSCSPSCSRACATSGWSTDDATRPRRLVARARPQPPAGRVHAREPAG